MVLFKHLLHTLLGNETISARDSCGRHAGYLLDVKKYGYWPLENGGFESSHCMELLGGREHEVG
jgi:hypothetical protein